jgi:predicted component of type VI protein secretion system
MQVLLRIANGKSNVRKVRLQSDTTIGRSPECQLKVASNQISRRHCQIFIRDGFVSIKDLGSANGTFVNGRRVPPEVEIPLTPGTRIMLGPLQFSIEYDLPIGLDASTIPGIHDESVEALPTNLPPVHSPKEIAKPKASPDAGRRAAFPARPNLSPMAAVPDLSDTDYSTSPVPPDIDVQIPFPAAAPRQHFAPGAGPAIPATPSAGKQEEPSEHDFNFGIFAASGSGVIVESASEISNVHEPIAKLPTAPVAPGSAVAKPPKKGFLNMLGWGKKESAQPASAVPTENANAVPEPKEVYDEPSTVDGSADASLSETPYRGSPSFDLPDVEIASNSPGDSDQSLQNFFNGLK